MSSQDAAAGAASARPMRADAVRNRAKVLDAARAAFAAEGPAVPLDEIARRAGVGAGTVYRHFPTKEALFEAVIVDRLHALAEDAEARLAGGGDPGAEFFAFFFTLAEDAARKADLAEALTASGVDFQPGVKRGAERLGAAFEALLSLAQQAGAVRADVTVADLHALVVGAMAAEKYAGGAGGKLARVVGDGLRAAAATDRN